MPSLHLLGTGASISDPHRTTTMLAFADEDVARGTVVVDCGGDVVQRLLASDVPLDSIAALIATHAHPDHVAGFPLFMEKIWLAGREVPIPVCGIDPAIDQVERSWDAFEPVHRDWDALPPIDWMRVPHEVGTTMWMDARWTVTSAPVDHGDMPNVGLRVEHRPTGATVAYSCDTAPCDAVVDLATGADLLIHEANGTGDNHSTAADAARVARTAGAARLLLVHLPPGDKSDALAEAQSIFPNTELGEELGRYELQGQQGEG